VGRHSAPVPEGTVVDRRPLYLLATAAAVVLVLLVAGVAYGMTRGGDDGTTTATAGSTASRTPSSGSPSSSATASPSPTPSAATSTPPTTPSPTATKKPPRPPTLRLRLVGTSYVRVRSGGRTLLEQVLRKGQTRTFDQRSVTALIGNAAAVRATVNGKPRQPGRAGQIQTIVARR